VVLEATIAPHPLRQLRTAHWVSPGWVRRFTAANRVGTYLSVVKGGTVSAGDTVEVTRRPEHGVTAAQVFAGLDGDAASRLLAADAHGVVLAPQVRKAALQALSGA
jgi:MOSC domain-containing protein YiiM